MISKEADVEEIALHEDWAKGLVYCDIEGFAITEDGELILADECGKFAYCPDGRFEVQFDGDELEKTQGEWIIDGHHYKCSRCGKTLAIMFSETDDDLIGCPFCLSKMKGGAE